MEKKMATYDNTFEIKEDIKHVGYFMYFCAVVQAFMAWAIDPYFLFDVFLCVYLGYRACYKPGKYLMLWISIYYGLSILLALVDGGTAIHGWAIKGFIMYWLTSTTIKAFKEMPNQKYTAINAS